MATKTYIKGTRRTKRKNERHSGALILFRPPLRCGLNEGSALLIALIVMGILMTIALGTSELLIGAMRDSRILLEKTAAWYAAESGIEQALLDVYSNQPGFETQAQNPDYEYRIQAAASEFPVKKPYEIQFEKDKYAALRLNESVTIPLFRGSNPEDAVKNFRADYYLAPDLKLQNEFVDDDMDILRWKIFGIAKQGVAAGTMEVINEFVPANQGNSAQQPTCLGASILKQNCYNAAKFYQRELAADGSIEFNIKQEHRISDFLETHAQNFLVLTNMVNVDLVAGALGTAEKKAIANIMYRIIDENGKPNLTLPSIKISSDGYAESTKQSIDLEVKRDSFLPVFNYALYGTAQ